MRRTMLIVSLLLMPDEARACAEAKEAFHQLLGFSPESSDAVFLEGAVERSPGGCVTHSLALVVFAPDGTERRRTPLPADLLASLGVVDARRCSTEEPTQVSPMPSAPEILTAVRASASLERLLPPVRLTSDAKLSSTRNPDKRGEVELLDPRTEVTFEVSVRFAEGGALRQGFLGSRAGSPQLSSSPDGTRVLLQWDSNQPIAGHRAGVHRTEVVLLTESCRRSPSRAECDRPAPDRFARRPSPP